MFISNFRHCESIEILRDGHFNYVAVSLTNIAQYNSIHVDVEQIVSQKLIGLRQR